MTLNILSPETVAATRESCPDTRVLVLCESHEELRALFEASLDMIAELMGYPLGERR